MNTYQRKQKRSKYIIFMLIPDKTFGRIVFFFFSYGGMEKVRELTIGYWIISGVKRIWCKLNARLRHIIGYCTVTRRTRFSRFSQFVLVNTVCKTCKNSQIHDGTAMT